MAISGNPAHLVQLNSERFSELYFTFPSHNRHHVYIPARARIESRHQGAGRPAGGACAVHPRRRRPLHGDSGTSLPGARTLPPPGAAMNIRVSTGILCVLCVVTLLLLFRNIERTLPLPHHSDEGFIAGPASKILQTGDLHPYKFNYPSLPA